MSTARSTVSRKMRALLLATMLAIALSACGTEGNGSGTGKTASDAFPVTIKAENGAVKIKARPRRIVSLSATATEVLFAIDAGEQVVAVDDQSDYPPGVPTTKLSAYTPNVEAIAQYKPDLVIATGDGELKALKNLKIPLLVHPAATTLDEAYEQIEQTGLATGHSVDAAQEVASIKSQIAETLASAPRFTVPPTFYHELDDTYFSVTSKTFIGEIYKLAGLENIADRAEKASADYPQLSAEYIVRADPYFIFLGDTECCRQSAATVKKRPGWGQITAVRNGTIVPVGDDLSSRWGPRVVDFLRLVVNTLNTSKAASE
jgi:iron complex transport system substrate-binding protein